MTIRIAINGYGRIGRNILRAHYEKKLHPEIQIVAINDLGDVQTNAHLTRYDTTHGKFPGEVTVAGNEMIINGDKIRVVAERDPRKLPWKELNIDLVLEEKESAIVVPFDSVFIRGGKDFVYIVKDGKAVVKEVAVGIQQKEQIEINNGLDVGDEIIITGTDRNSLFDGSSVKTVKELSNKSADSSKEKTK